MRERNEFWQRWINETLFIELVPGERPGLLIERVGQPPVEVDYHEIRSLIDTLTVALGELYILKNPETVAKVQSLLSTDVTLTSGNGPGEQDAVDGRMGKSALLKRYRTGERSFAGADLRRANLSGADLRGIELNGADLSGANLEGTNLRAANLAYANLSGANLRKADLTDAQVTQEQLAQAQVLTDAILPDGTRHA